MKRILIVLLLITPWFIQAQGLRWAPEGNAYYRVEGGEINRYSLPANTKTTFVSRAELTPAGAQTLRVRNYAFSKDQSKLLIFTNTQRVWRLDTRGDYWVLDLKTKALTQIGKSRPASSLMFAKLSPDGTKAAYVSEQNVYVEELSNGQVKAITTDGNRKLINGTFDWAYEEEFACRDGFQWSPDSKQLSFWQLDARQIRDFYMINNTDSVYSKIIPVEYPTAGQTPSPARIGVADVTSGKITWLALPGDAKQHYLPRMEWNSATEILVQQLNRKQNESKIFSCHPQTGVATQVYVETDAAWIDLYTPWENVYALDFRHYFRWLNGGKEFLWMSEKDGWRHAYRISKDGTKQTLITVGDYDVMDIRLVDEKNNLLYFLASPQNATQKYLYKIKLDGKGKAELVTPSALAGTHDYSISPTGTFATHSFNNSFTKPVNELIALPKHMALNEKESIQAKLKDATQPKTVEFFKVKTEEGVEMDGWMVKPTNFDATKKYPVVFYVYTEPWGANVHDTYGAADNHLFTGDMAEEGYIYMSIDNRGTPAPKGRAWRKSVYRKIGLVNIKDQALAAKEILKWPFVDADRIAVWGWSGGGSATLNLMFQYPEIYKTGIAVAAVANQLTYDNMYQERYMGLPQENLQDFIAGSPITYAKNLQGNLLYIHGTGDDNVHYANAEMLVNELVKHGKQFQFMAYPNRTHGISEGEGTSEHLATLYSDYLRKHCPPGPR
ncbi:MAG TPA: S9 family peptidase [Cytophagales bacterium]|nr:S9 family peptidase [Cytophagales bacterium]HRG07280.1 DPP IV N-terminal domain-containing protein [Cyclobacteriaceae bacterium]